VSSKRLTSEGEILRVAAFFLNIWGHTCIKYFQRLEVRNPRIRPFKMIGCCVSLEGYRVLDLNRRAHICFLCLCHKWLQTKQLRNRREALTHSSRYRNVYKTSTLKWSARKLSETSVIFFFTSTRRYCTVKRTNVKNSVINIHSCLSYTNMYTDERKMPVTNSLWCST
jgi:hypothetical protein